MPLFPLVNGIFILLLGANDGRLKFSALGDFRDSKIVLCEGFVVG